MLWILLLIAVMGGQQTQAQHGGNSSTASTSIGALVTAIPEGSQQLVVDGHLYFINNGIAYVKTFNGYRVVPIPSILRRRSAAGENAPSQSTPNAPQVEPQRNVYGSREVSSAYNPTSADDTSKSIKLRLLEQDIKVCKAITKKQVDLFSLFFDALTVDDIKEIQTIGQRGGEVQIFNDRAMAALRELRKIGIRPQGTSSPDVMSTYFPWSLAGLNNVNISNYARILREREISVNDEKTALEMYAEYTVDYLDKVQFLKEKSDKCGWPFINCPREGNNTGYLAKGYATLFLYSMEKPEAEYFDLCTYGEYEMWHNSAGQYPVLYSIPSVLKAQKMWLDFLLNNNFTFSHGKIHTEELMTEIEKIKKRLAVLSKPAMPMTERVSVTTEQTTNQLDTTKGKTPERKFKLELPE